MVITPVSPAIDNVNVSLLASAVVSTQYLSTKLFNHIDLYGYRMNDEKMYSHWVDRDNGVIGDIVLMSSSVNFDKSFYDLLDILVEKIKSGSLGLWTEHQLYQAITTAGMACKGMAFPAFFIYREYHNEFKQRDFDFLFSQADITHGTNTRE